MCFERKKSFFCFFFVSFTSLPSFLFLTQKNKMRSSITFAITMTVTLSLFASLVYLNVDKAHNNNNNNGILSEQQKKMATTTKIELVSSSPLLASTSSMLPKSLQRTFDDNDLVIKYKPWNCLSSMKYPNASHIGTTVITSLLVSEKQGYLQGALVLGYTLRKKVDMTNVDMILMVLNDFELSRRAAKDLTKVGWQICRLPMIKSNFQEEILPRFQKTFVKVAPFTWLQYKRFVVLDLDTLPVGNLAELISPTSSPSSHTPDCFFDAVYDYEEDGFKPHFNSGVFASCPSLAIFDYFMKFIKTRNDYHIFMGVQGALNKVAEEGMLKVNILPWDFNADLAIYEGDRHLWDSHASQLQMIHYTTAKPFDYLNTPNAVQRRWPPIQRWFEHYKQMRHELAILQ